MVKAAVQRERNAIFSMYFTTPIMNSGKQIEVSKHQLDNRVGDLIVTLTEIGIGDQGQEVERDTEVVQGHHPDHHIQDINILGQGQGIDTTKDPNIEGQIIQDQDHGQDLGVTQDLEVLLGQGQKKENLENNISQEATLSPGQSHIHDQGQGPEVEKSIRTPVKGNNCHIPKINQQTIIMV